LTQSGRGSKKHGAVQQGVDSRNDSYGISVGIFLVSRAWHRVRSKVMHSHAADFKYGRWHDLTCGRPSRARKSALLWTRLMNSVDMIRTSETPH
jgi:hypothetical protein